MMILISIILALFLVYIVNSTFDATGLYILLIGIIGFFVWVVYYGIKSDKRENKELEKSKKRINSLMSKHGSSRGTWNINYLGGHPSFNSMNCVLKLYDEAIVLIDYYIDTYAEIFYKDITDVELISKEHITQSPTLSKVLLFGIASLAMQKEKVYKNNFVIISYTNSGINSKVIIKSIQASNIYNTINRCRIEYNKRHGIATKTDEPKNSKNNVTEQIRELAKLRDENIISEDEFQKKKEQLLSKI